MSSVPYAALLGLAPTSAANMALGSPWAVAVALAIAFLALVLTVTLHQRVQRMFGQRRVAGLLASFTVTGGWSVGASGWTIASYAHTPTPPFDLEHIATSPTIPRETWDGPRQRGDRLGHRRPVPVDTGPAARAIPAADHRAAAAGRDTTESSSPTSISATPGSGTCRCSP